MKNTFDPKQFENKWRNKWKESGIYTTPESVTPENKFYILPQLPYPSGSGLHMGHSEVYTACDIFARYQRMKGKDVLQVIGWDAFGLPAENYAIKTNVHPRVNTDKAIENFREQIKSLGVSVDWDREVGSHNPDYYKWTQWFFQLFFKRGLAYRKKQIVNWCSSCKTVLANEQVEEGKCERCDTEIELKEMPQWYLKITEYADRLQKDLDKVDWPQETVKRQREWIGKSIGASVEFSVVSSKEISEELTRLTVFTTAHDTIFGATFMVIAPEHKLITNYKLQITNFEEIEKYAKAAKQKTELERQQQKEKTGVKVEGLSVVNPMTKKKMPIFVADYVLANYGTGAVMGVPGHDERDNEFAQLHGIEIVYVVDGDNDFVSYTGEIKSNPEKYKIKNSAEYDGMSFKLGRQAMIDDMVKKGIAVEKTEFRLRDWSVSRQRFWGAPIPMLFSEEESKKGYGYAANEKLNVLVLPGFAFNSDMLWYPWIKKELEQMGHTVEIPTMPDPKNPKYGEWMQYLETTYKEWFKDPKHLVVIGHSMGGYTALKLGEKYPIASVLLIAPAPQVTDVSYFTGTPLEKYATVLTNYAKEAGSLDIQRIKDNIERLSIMYSTDDKNITVEEQRKLISTLDWADYKEFSDKGHWGLLEQCEKLPEALYYITPKGMTDMPGWFPILEEDLPVILPDDVDFKPTGQSPLTYSDSYQNGIEEKYGKGWRLEVDTLDTFMCSSWYYFRYIDPKNDKAFASKESIESWMPVDYYLGGPEHVNGHLLYSRFFTKVLYDAGFINFDEPFLVHKHQGLIHGTDGRKMSKRWGNVINPTDAVDEHGADTIRTYIMFMGPLEQDKAWSEDAVQGVGRFLKKVWNLSDKVESSFEESASQERMINKLIKSVTDDIERMSYNTAVAKMMAFTNDLLKEKNIEESVWERFLLILAPYAPYITEELWEKLGKEYSIHQQKWPTYDTLLVKDDLVHIVIQVNGKMRATVEVPTDAEEDVVYEAAMQDDKVKKYLEGDPKKKVFVKNRIMNIII